MLTKAMLLVGCLSSLVLFDPTRAVAYLGPQASWLGWKITSALSIERAVPQTTFFGRR
jgi:hypothetical protein